MKTLSNSARLVLLVLLVSMLSGMNTPASVASGPPFASGDASCLETSTATEITMSTDCVGSIVIPDGITSIADFAFQNATELTGITIPNSVTSIGARAFQNATGLTSIIIPNSVTSIGERAFQDATSLTSVTLSSGITEIADYTFKGAISLTNLSLPEGVVSIGSSAFEDATDLAEVSIPNSVTTIGESAFSGTYSLSSITIPEGVTEIKAYTFYSSSTLTSVVIPSTVSSIGLQAFTYAIKLNSIRFLGAPPSLGSWAFDFTADDARALVSRAYFDSFTAEFLVNSNWNEIELGVYTYPTNDANCLSSSGATVINGIDCAGSITIPSSRTSVAENAFSQAESLTGVTFPSGLTSIGASAFESATSLSIITFLGAAPTIGANSFINIAAGAVVRVNQVHQSTFDPDADGFWNGLTLEIFMIPVINPGESESTAEIREKERLREIQKRLARAKLALLARDSAPLTLDLFNQASITGVTIGNFTQVSSEISELPIERRSQIEEILKIARKFEIVDKVASNQKIYSGMLQEVGLIPRDSKNKAALTATLRKLPASERSSYLAIKQAIDAQMTEIQTRKQRLSEVLASIAARRQS